MPFTLFWQKLIPGNSADRFKTMYLILAATCLGIILVVSAGIIRWNSSADLKNTVVSNSERIIDSIYYTEVDAIMPLEDKDGYTIGMSPTAHDALDVRVRDMYDPLNIVMLMIFNRDGSVIYGDTRNLPDDCTNERHIDEAIKKGEAVYHLHKDKTIIDLVGEKREHVDLAEVYVPIRHKDGQVIGVFEVYTDVTPLTIKNKRQMVNSILAQTFMLLLLSMISYIIIIRESSELKLAYHKLETMATTDPLTGISNRRQLLERVEQHFALTQRSGDLKEESVGLGFIMMDVDYFKLVNDNFGHLAGDTILQELASKVNQELRQYDVFGRYGGEEFLVVLPNTLPEEARRIADRLVAAVSGHPFLWNDNPIQITLSAGVTWTNAGGETLDDVLSRVDRLMYQAKEQGRNQVVFSN
jgi:diguanylate cyclase (GGDEF)-like protein